MQKDLLFGCKLKRVIHMTEENTFLSQNNVILMASLIFALAVLGGAYIIGEGLGAESNGDEIYVSSEAEKDTVDVSATATRNVKPDLLKVSLRVESESESAEDSQSLAAVEANAIKEELYSLGIKEKDIQTAYYNVRIMTETHYICENTTYEREPGLEGLELEKIGSDCHWEQVQTGFKTTHVLSVDIVDIEMGGEVVDAAVSAGAAKIDNIRFTLKPDTKEQIQKELLGEAASDAKERADEIVGALDLSLGEPTSLVESYSYDYPNHYSFARAEGASDSTSLSPGQMSVSATVSASFEIE